MGKIAALGLALGLAAQASVLEASDPVLQGEKVDPALFSALRWRSIGPFRGGRVLAVAGVPGEMTHFYFGSVNGGVWETNDAGRTWRPIFDAQPIGSIGALALAPSNPKVIYVGTGEADMRSDIAQGDGMYKSTDGGKDFGPHRARRLAADRADPGRPARRGSRPGRGPRSPLRPERRARRLSLHATAAGPGSGCSTATRTPARSISPSSRAIPASCTRRSGRRGGRPGTSTRRRTGRAAACTSRRTAASTWTEIRGRGLPADPGRIGLAVAPSRPDRVYAIVDAEKGGLYRSDDDGATWTLTSDDPRIWGRGWYFGGIAVEPRDADVVYACNTSLYRSQDGGRTFAPIKGAPGGDDYHELWIDPEHPERRMLGVDQGAVVSLNGGETWSSWYNQPTGQFYHVATDNRFPYWVYGSQQDSGAVGVPSRTTERDGINLTQFREVTAGGENDSIAPDPNDPDVIFGGRVEKSRPLARGQTHTLDPTLAFPGRHRSVWTLPLVFSRRDPRVLYFARQQLFRTADGGRTWSAISPDLTREDPGVPPNLDPVTAGWDGGTGPRRGVIYTIAPSRVADGDLWVGTDDGLVWRSRDEGAHWSDVTPQALGAWSKVAMLEVSHTDEDTAWAAVDRHRLDDFAPYVYRTTDGGKSWTLSVDGIPSGSFVNAVREDPVRPGLLYAGTEKGVYVSFDDGDPWQALQLNLPVTSVRDLEVHGDDVVIATHGRGFWILDDVTPLRQVDAVLAREEAWLFAPGTAVRLQAGRVHGHAHAEGRADGGESAARRDPRLRAASRAVWTRDPRHPRREGRARPPLQQHRQGSRTEPRGAPPRAGVARPPVVLPATPGMHRFVWPLRYPAPPALGEGNTFADGRLGAARPLHRRAQRERAAPHAASRRRARPPGRD